MVTSLRSKWAVGKAVRAGLAVGGSISEPIRDRRATQPPAHFIATLWAGASWLFFRVARSTRMTQIWALLRKSGSDRLEKQPTDLRQNTSYFEDRTLDVTIANSGRRDRQFPDPLSHYRRTQVTVREIRTGCVDYPRNDQTAKVEHQTVREAHDRHVAH